MTPHESPERRLKLPVTVARNILGTPMLVDADGIPQLVTIYADQIAAALNAPDRRGAEQPSEDERDAPARWGESWDARHPDAVFDLCEEYADGGLDTSEFVRRVDSVVALRARLTEPAPSEHEIRVWKKKAEQFDRFRERLPFCPDHRDKVAGLPCRECEIEHLRASMGEPREPTREPTGACSYCGSTEKPIGAYPLTSCIACGRPWREFVQAAGEPRETLDDVPFPTDPEFTYEGQAAGVAAAYAEVAMRISGSYGTKHSDHPAQCFRWTHEFWNPAPDAETNLRMARALIDMELARLASGEEGLARVEPITPTGADPASQIETGGVTPDPDASEPDESSGGQARASSIDRMERIHGPGWREGSSIGAEE